MFIISYKGKLLPPAPRRCRWFSVMLQLEWRVIPLAVINWTRHCRHLLKWTLMLSLGEQQEQINENLGRRQEM